LLQKRCQKLLLNLGRLLVYRQSGFSAQPIVCLLADFVFKFYW